HLRYLPAQPQPEAVTVQGLPEPSAARDGRSRAPMDGFMACSGSPCPVADCTTLAVLQNTPSMLASSKKPDIRPALFSKTEVDTSRRQITEMPAPVDCEVLMRLAPKLLHLHRILTLHPARRMHVHRLVLAIHAILVLQAVSHHLKLQHTHRTHDQVVVAQRHEHLRRTF